MSKKFSEKWKEEKEAKKAAKEQKQGKSSISQEIKKGDSLANAFTNKTTINVEKFKGRHLFIATPAYGGMVGESYLKAMVRVGILFKTYGLNFTLATIANESLITRGRNTLVSMFMSDETYTDMIFIDADIHFEAESIIKMWDRLVDDGVHKEVEVVVGSYPKKSINWPSIISAVKKGVETEEELSKHQSAYVLNVRSDEQGRIPLRNGLLPVYDGGTGFMMFTRNVIQRMMDKWPELHYNNDLNTNPKHDPYCYALFDTIICPQTKRYLSEDYTFCRRYQEIGGTIWMDPSINLDHQGSYVFKGNIANQFTYNSEASSEEADRIQKQINAGELPPTPSQLKKSESESE